MRPKINRDLFTFQTSWRVRFSEVDMHQVVHHSQTIKYLEIGRVEYWRQLGIGYQDFLDSGYQYVVAKVECDYLKPLLFDQIITVMVRVAGFTRTSITYEYLIYDDSGDCAIFAHTVLVCLREGGNRPQPLPKDYLQQIINYEIVGSVEYDEAKFAAARR